MKDRDRVAGVLLDLTGSTPQSNLKVKHAHQRILKIIDEESLKAVQEARDIWAQSVADVIKLNMRGPTTIQKDGKK